MSVSHWAFMFFASMVAER